MKPLLLFICVFVVLISTAQDKEFKLQGQVVDSKLNPVSDAYIFNLRNSVKDVSRSNGVFEVGVLPGDSIVISHISFLRKVVTVHQLMINPIIQLDLDTINIRPVNVSASQRSDYEKALKNMESIEFDFRPQPDDAFTETERMKTLINTENQVERAYSNSLNFLQFSPSEQIGKMVEKRKKKKEAKQFLSTKEIEEKE
jgi:hypothetical protein